MQSGTIPDQESVWESHITQENITFKRAKRSDLSQQVTNRQDSMAKTKTKYKYQKETQKKRHLGTVCKTFFGGLKHVSRNKPIINSDDQDAYEGHLESS